MTFVINTSEGEDVGIAGFEGLISPFPHRGIPLT